MLSGFRSPLVVGSSAAPTRSEAANAATHFSARSMLTAQLCLIPEGDTVTSRRLFDALAAGCVPVLLRLNPAVWLADLPFPRVVNWSSIALVHEWPVPPERLARWLEQHAADTPMLEAMSTRGRVSFEQYFDVDCNPSGVAAALLATASPTLTGRGRGRLRQMGAYVPHGADSAWGRMVSNMSLMGPHVTRRLADLKRRNIDVGAPRSTDRLKRNRSRQLASRQLASPAKQRGSRLGTDTSPVRPRKSRLGTDGRPPPAGRMPRSLSRMLPPSVPLRSEPGSRRALPDRMPVRRDARADGMSFWRGMWVPCGYVTDCEPVYELAAVNRSAATWGELEPSVARELEQRHASGRRGCEGRTDATSRSGGFCYHDDSPPTRAPSWGARSYAVPKWGSEADAIITAQLLTLLRTPHGHLSLSDFGAGVGQYGHALLAADKSVRWSGYDGAGNVEEFTGGFVRWFDLSLPLSLPRSDWVMCLEVGEHVPHTHEMMVLRNLHAHNCRGVILSWAALNQSGHMHVNNHRREYLAERMQGLGYRLDAHLSHKFRHGSPHKLGPQQAGALPNHPWFRDNVQVFRRLTPLRGQGCTRPRPAHPTYRHGKGQTL
mgnify:CR=1 FL=1